MSTHSSRNTQANPLVLARKEAMRKNETRTISPEIPALDNNTACTAPLYDTTPVIDLYSAGFRRISSVHASDHTARTTGRVSQNQSSLR
jgi:hypothetical protein